jgi:hypothetical protein
MVNTTELLCTLPQILLLLLLPLQTVLDRITMLVPLFSNITH